MNGGTLLRRKQKAAKNAATAHNYITEMHIGEFHAVVTQLGECKTEDLEVAGSSPAHGTITYHSKPTSCIPEIFKYTG